MSNVDWPSARQSRGKRQYEQKTKSKTAQAVEDGRRFHTGYVEDYKYDRSIDAICLTETEDRSLHRIYSSAQMHASMRQNLLRTSNPFKPADNPKNGIRFKRGKLTIHDKSVGD